MTDSKISDTIRSINLSLVAVRLIAMFCLITPVLHAYGWIALEDVALEYLSVIGVIFIGLGLAVDAIVVEIRKKRILKVKRVKG